MSTKESCVNEKFNEENIYYYFIQNLHSYIVSVAMWKSPRILIDPFMGLGLRVPKF